MPSIRITKLASVNKSATKTEGRRGGLSSKQAMIEATIESIYQFGLPHTTVTTVTGLAGLSRGMVRRLFDSKEQMLVATMDALRLEWFETTERLAGGEPDDPLAAFETSIEASNNPKMLAILEAGQKQWAEQFARPLRFAGLKNANSIAAAVLALGDGLWLQHSRNPDAMPRARAEELAVMAALAMVQQPAAEPPSAAAVGGRR